MTEPRTIDLSTPDLTEQNIQKLKELFPDVVTESEKEGRTVHAIDFDALKRDLSANTTVVEGQKERYAFTWPGKTQAKIEARTPIDKTLRPQKDKSINWDSTRNVYIEGDNLEALKLMQQAYMGKIKMIYIDPPYNTGHDFVYHDDFSESDSEFREGNADFDDEGNRLTPNLETNGRFHSDWCSMIYPRLLLARDLLTEDGAIFISIDDHEQANLKKICDEIFGANNFVANFVWSQGRKNDSHFVSNSHEYILVYCRNLSYLQEHKLYWRMRKDGLDSIYREYEKLKKQYGVDYESMTRELKLWYRSLADSDPAKQQSQYSKVDARGIYFPDNISWPGGGGPQYTVLHPITKKPVKNPSGGWRFSSPERMQEEINAGRVEFGSDETKVPTIKRYLKDHETAVPYSVFYEDGRGATKRLRQLMGGDVFEHPKDENILRSLVQMLCTQGDETILDFFSGSATTAQAVMEANAEDGGHRKFILVQIPEQVDEKSPAGQAGYKTICEIGEERIRRASQKIKETVEKDNLQLTLAGQTKDVPDIGFRVFKIDSSNKNPVNQTPAKIIQGELFKDAKAFKEDRTPGDLLYGILPSFGLPYSSPIVERKLSSGYTVLAVPDVSNEGYQLVTFLDQERDITVNEVKEVAAWPEAINNVVFLGFQIEKDSVVDDIEELFRMREPETQRWII